MKKRSATSFLSVTAAMIFSANFSYANFECVGGLTAAQAAGFEAFFSPNYSPALTNLGDGSDSSGYAKVLSRQEFDLLNVATPIISVETSLSSTNAEHLKRYLNENANYEIPGYLAGALSIFIPRSWVGLAADSAIQLLNSSSSGGRTTMANVAGTVSENGVVGVIHRVAEGSSGQHLYIWSYVYTATLNGTNKMFLLRNCSADVELR